MHPEFKQWVPHLQEPGIALFQSKPNLKQPAIRASRNSSLMARSFCRSSLKRRRSSLSRSCASARCRAAPASRSKTVSILNGSPPTGTSSQLQVGISSQMAGRLASVHLQPLSPNSSYSKEKEDFTSKCSTLPHCG